MKKALNCLLLFFLCTWLYCGQMVKPRTVNVISTQYFDFLFPEESKQTAVELSTLADSIYTKAKEVFCCNYDFRTTVVISPDSDTLSVKYTASPYNRIVVFDAVDRPGSSFYDNGLIDLFSHEVNRAVSQSVRTKAMDFVAKHFLGDSFQPAALFNMPYSFLEGAVYSTDENAREGILYDNWNIQSLMQAKVEGKFPSVLQTTGAYDIYPGNKTDYIAAAAFYAYIQQKWGFEKFGEYWQECGKLQFFHLDKKIFLKVYGQDMNDAWQEFIQAIPVPDKLPEPDQDGSKAMMKIDYDSNYKFIVSTNYGLVWYDDLKEEVDISGSYEYENFKQLLFLAKGITNLTVSPCGRFLVVSYIKGGEREKFEKDAVRIFDLKQRKFLSESYAMRDASVVILKDGHYGIIGNDTHQGGSCLKIYESHEMNALLGFDNSTSRLVYSRQFDKACNPASFAPLGKNYFACLVHQGKEWLIMISDIAPENGNPNTEDLYTISNGRSIDSFLVETLEIRNLRFADYAEVSGKRNTREKSFCLLYDYVLQNYPSFVRTGWLFFDENSVPVRSIITTGDFYGGCSSGAMYNCHLYYASNRYKYSEIRYINLNDISFTEALISYSHNEIPYPQPQTEDIQITNGNYSPWKYMKKKGSFSFFMPVRDITLDEGVKTAPGLGAAFKTSSDPWENNEFLISAAKGFIPLDFTEIFNADQKAKDKLRAEKIELSKDSAVGLYYKNTSTPADIVATAIFKFNDVGEYTFSAFTDVKFSIPLGMMFRRFYFDFSCSLLSSTTYWDMTQTELFPNLSGWPDFSHSYRMWQTQAFFNYSNIHQYGLSPLKKLGISAGGKMVSSWKWGEWNPFQINLGVFGTGEIPFLIPVQNYNNIILSLPTTVHAELFFTNGKAVDAYAQMLLAGMEIQNGFWRLYFPRVALYAGYDIALEYDTVLVKLPDLRHLERFYDIFASCYLNDSFYFQLDFDITPVLGKYSKYKLESSLRFEKYIRSKEFKLKFDIQITN